MTALQSIPASMPSPAAHAAVRTYDGVICFGGVDWWYHNRGHYDIQMMREFSAHVPVLYVNSIGMRVPKVGEGKMFLKRVRRKLKSLSRGFTRVTDTFGVFSPVVLPGAKLGAMTRKTLGFQARRAARRMGIRSPLVWVACPPAAATALAMDRAGLVYQRTDRFEAYKGVDPEVVKADDRRLKQAADVTLFCSSLLIGQERSQCRCAAFVDHGVDAPMFESAGDRRDDPADVASLPRPRVGFVGGIDSHTFDPELFLKVAQLLPDLRFVLVGACSLPAGWCQLPNVTLLGQRPYDQVASYMAACDVLIMPWVNSDWIRACNPVKLKEYLATARPVVTTWFDELERYNGLVRVARDAEGFAAAIRDALARPGDVKAGRAFVHEQTWTRKAADVIDALRTCSIEPAGSPRARTAKGNTK